MKLNELGSVLSHMKEVTALMKAEEESTTLQKLESILEGIYKAESFKSWWNDNKGLELYKSYLDTNEIEENEYSFLTMARFENCLVNLIGIIEDAPTWTQEELEEFVREKIGLCREEASIALEATLNGDIVFNKRELQTLGDFVVREKE